MPHPPRHVLQPAPLLVAASTAAAAALGGCINVDDSEVVADRPVATGRLVSGEFWFGPVGGPGTTTNTTFPPGSTVRVYEGFVLVTDDAGNSHVSPHGWYTNLRFTAAE